MREQEDLPVKTKTSMGKKAMLATAAVATAAAVTYSIKIGFNVSSTSMGTEAVKEERHVKGNDSSTNIRKKTTTGDITSESVIFN